MSEKKAFRNVKAEDASQRRCISLYLKAAASPPARVSVSLEPL
jgi:hypothetical protein